MNNLKLAEQQKFIETLRRMLKTTQEKLTKSNLDKWDLKEKLIESEETNRVSKGIIQEYGQMLVEKMAQKQAIKMELERLEQVMRG